MVAELFRERVDKLLEMGGPGRAAKQIVLTAGIAGAVVLAGAGLARVARAWDVRPWLLQLAAFLGYLVYIETKLRRHLCLPSQVVGVDEFVSRARTGDLMMFRSYRSSDGVEMIFFRHIVAWLSDAFYGHIGMVVERDGEKYLFESVESIKGSALSSRKKPGVVLRPLGEAVREYEGRVRLYASEGLRAHVDPEALWHYVQTTQDQPFAPRGPSCVELVRDAFWTQGLLKTWPLMVVPGWFADPRHYAADVSFQRFTADNGWAE